MFRLFTTAFNTANPGRREELDFALQANLSAFHDVCVLSENYPRPEWFQGDWFVGDARQEVRDLIAMAAFSQPQDIVVLANSDIAFTRYSLEMMEAYLQPNEAYCLSRWDFVPGKGCVLFDKDYTQDSWAFRGPPKPTIGGDYWFGRPGIDNALAHEIDAAGYRVLNPSKTIRSYHPHVCGERLSNDGQLRIMDRPYFYVKPHLLGDKPRYRRGMPKKQKAGTFQV